MKFNDVFKKNLSEDYYSEYRNYYSTMYGYNKETEAEKNAKEELEKKKKEEQQKAEDEKKREKIDKAKDEYLNDIDDIKYTYSRKVRRIEKTIEDLEKKNKANPSQSLENKIDDLNKQLQDFEDDIDDKIRNLNRRLRLSNREAYSELLDDDDLVKDFSALDENLSFENIDCKLSITEMNLVFGETLEDIENIIMLENAETISARIRLAMEGIQKAKKDGNVKQVQELNLQLSKLKELQAEGEKKNKDPLVMKESEAQIEADKESIEKLRLKIEKNNEITEKKNESVEKQIDAKQRRIETSQKIAKIKKEEESEDDSQSFNESKEIIATDIKNKEELVSDDVEELNEDLRQDKLIYKPDPTKNVIKDLRNEKLIYKNMAYADNIRSMLYNGTSGVALKYVLEDEINNANSAMIEILKRVKNDSEAQIVIKKIKALLVKAEKKDLSKDEYTQVKVLKSQFMGIYKKIKTEYENRYKN